MLVTVRGLAFFPFFYSKLGSLNWLKYSKTQRTTLPSEPFFSLFDFGVLKNETMHERGKIFVEHALNVAKLQFWTRV